MLIRQTAPVLGAESPYQRPQEWNVTFATRGLQSDTHYRLDERQVERETLGTYVINRQFAADLTVSYNCSQRLSLAVGVPYVAASWSIPSPTSPVPGPRAQQDARGFGDISVTTRYWLFSPATFTGNIAIGGGVKLPTGKYDAQDLFPDRDGRNNQLRYVDQSIQPGDGGWGIYLSVEGFKRMGRVQVFGSGNYLANPRDTNGTPSLTVSRLPPGVKPPASNADRLVNPMGFYKNRKPDPYTGLQGDATFPRYICLASYGWRFGGKDVACAVPPPS